MTPNKPMDSNNIHKKNEKVFVAAGIVGLVLIVIVFLFTYTKSQYIRIDELKSPVVKDSNVAQKNVAATHTALSAADIEKGFANLRLSAKSAVVWDVRNKKFIYQKNAEDVLPLASLTKLMTVLTAVELLPKQSTIRIAQEYLQEENGGGLLADERWNTDDLISLTLVASSNVGSRAIATVAGAFLPAQQKVTSDPRQNFVTHLNDRAKELGFDSMHFYNDSGLDVDLTHAGAFGSAADVAKLTNYILNTHPELLEATTHSKIEVTPKNNSAHIVKNTNTVVDDIPGVISSKTGYTDLAQGNLAVAFAPGLDGPYIAVVLGSTFDGRFTDIEKLVDATTKAVSQ